MLPLAAVLLAAALLAGCASSPPAPEPAADYSSIKLDELVALSENDPERCLEALSALENSGASSEVDAARLASLASAAGRKIAARFSEEKSSGRWRDAELSFYSLRALASLGREAAGAEGALSEAARAAVSPSGDGAGATLYLGMANDCLARKLYAPGAAYLLKSLEFAARAGASLPREDMAVWRAKALAEKDLRTLSAISAALNAGAPGKEGVEGASLSAAPAASLSDMASGVVTVYVDRGLAIRDGVGYPDRVLGTAFQVDSQGYYLTNYHVVASEVDPEYNGYSRLSIRPQSNPDARIPASVVGWDIDLDLAVIKSQETAPYTYRPYHGAAAEKGEKVIAIGSPVGLESSVSAGIVSAAGRRILPRGEALQIDVPVNPGNSGGPLLDEKGGLVGVVFAGLSGFQGLNFALPAAWISTVFPSLFAGGRHQAAWIGVMAAKNLDGSLDLSYVFPGSGGFAAGDRLFSIDGASPGDIQRAQMSIAARPAGALCAVTIRRGGATSTLLRKTAAIDDAPFKKAVPRDIPERLLEGATGMLVEHVSGARGAGGTYKVARVWPGLAADESGIGEGDILGLIRWGADAKKRTIYFDVRAKSQPPGVSWTGGGGPRRLKSRRVDDCPERTDAIHCDR
ncbi:trypsin-like peptidase domain-containing protein [bacterium]|nr:trypsin-like peptidase domain-containing protein [bacterium]